MAPQRWRRPDSTERTFLQLFVPGRTRESGAKVILPEMQISRVKDTWRGPDYRVTLGCGEEFYWSESDLNFLERLIQDIRRLPRP